MINDGRMMVLTSGGWPKVGVLSGFVEIIVSILGRSFDVAALSDITGGFMAL